MNVRPLAAALCAALAMTSAACAAGSGLVIASIYWPGDGVVQAHDTATSSGHRYDAKAMRCAHRTMALGTRLMLTSPDRAFAADVIINDRGPFKRGRDLDCTPAVNAALHLNGLGPVRIEYYPPLPRPRPEAAR